ncbi:MAG: sensor histidine kinase [Polynucleobacter sp.]
MNSFATLALVYAVFTIVSSGLLYAAFRKRMDESAIYFLISDFFMASTCVILFLTNIQYVGNSSLIMGLSNFTSLSAEVGIMFSLLSLSRKFDKKWSLAAFLLMALIAAYLELIRDQAGLHAIVLVMAVFYTTLFSITFYICKFSIPKPLASNQFIRIFTWFELGMVGYGVVRIFASFAPLPVTLRFEPSNLAVIIFSVYIVMGAFRYMSYIGLRVTWVDPTTLSQNRLNEPLLKIIEEKDRLLSGLISSNRVIGISALAGSLSHQLSQPLTAIALRADTARRALTRAGKDPEMVESLEEISHQSSKLAELVKNLRRLFSSRTIEYAPTKLEGMIEEILEIVSPSLEAKKITLRKSYRDDPTVYADTIQLQQVIINVLNNAIDALNSDQITEKSISIDLFVANELVTIEIKDSGAGINGALLPSIFELYKTTKEGGLGIGLWLCKEIMESHHGDITAINVPTGGAIFKITLPVHRNHK